MIAYEYQIIPSPRRPKKVKGVKDNAGRFAHLLTEVVNEEAAKGWEYIRSETLPIIEKQGMFKGSSESYQSFLVFRRPQKVTSAETDQSAKKPV